MRTDLPAYVRQIYVRDFRARIGLWQSLPPHPSRLASYLVSVRRTSVLPAASFRFHLAMDTLAVQLAVPLAEPALDFHQLVNAPCRAHKVKMAHFSVRHFRSIVDLSKTLPAQDISNFAEDVQPLHRIRLR